MSLSKRTQDILEIGLADKKAAAEIVDGIETGSGTSTVKADGSVPFTADQSMAGHKLTNLAAPAAANDAARKTYVDTADALKQNAAFTPAAPSDWSPAPTTVQGALDQLAARVKALEP